MIILLHLACGYRSKGNSNMDKNIKDNYFPIAMGVGTFFGLLFDHLTLFVCIGVSVYLVFSNTPKK